MKRFSIAELKKSILAAEAESLKHRLQFRAPQKGGLVSEKIVSRFLAEAGLDKQKLQALQKRRDAELKRVVAKHKADALRRASKQKRALHPRVAGQTNAFRDLASKGGFFPHPSFTLDTPFLIWTTPLLGLSDSATAPFTSWAKFKLATDDVHDTQENQGTQKVSFYFYWRNPFSDYAVINASTFLSATGHLTSHAPWTFAVNNSTWVQAWAWFGLWFGVSRDLDPTGYVTEFLGQTGAYAYWMFGSDTAALSISSGSSLSRTMFAVPPGNVVVFEVALAVNYDNHKGSLEADFESGDFRIACPLVVCTLLNSPPERDWLNLLRPSTGDGRTIG